ncbi:MAG: hypothetical protein QOF78_2000 [Phycisphaerales bacterium]|nr:hypothetical protein [Phycisphaerales bacterium]
MRRVLTDVRRASTELAEVSRTQPVAANGRFLSAVCHFMNGVPRCYCAGLPLGPADGSPADGTSAVRRTSPASAGRSGSPHRAETEGRRCPRLRARSLWLLPSRNGYLLGSYRIATAPEPNSSRLTSFKSRGFDSPANNVGPWPATLGCTTNSYSSINLSSANASGSVTPPTNSPPLAPLPAPSDSRLSCSTAFARSPRPDVPSSSSAFQSTPGGARCSTRRTSWPRRSCGRRVPSTRPSIRAAAHLPATATRPASFRK